MGLLDKIKAIYMHGLVAGHANNLTYGGTNANISILGNHLVKSGAKQWSIGKSVVRILSKVGPIQYLVVHSLGKVILNNKSQ